MMKKMRLYSYSIITTRDEYGNRNYDIYADNKYDWWNIL